MILLSHWNLLTRVYIEIYSLKKESVYITKCYKYKLKVMLL